MMPDRLGRLEHGQQAGQHGQDERADDGPAYPPRPPKIDVPPMTAAATDGSRYESAASGRVALGDAGEHEPAMPARTPERTYSTEEHLPHAHAREAGTPSGLSPTA